MLELAVRASMVVPPLLLVLVLLALLLLALLWLGLLVVGADEGLARQHRRLASA